MTIRVIVSLSPPDISNHEDENPDDADPEIHVSYRTNTELGCGMRPSPVHEATGMEGDCAYMNMTSAIVADMCME